jgi:Domain of unknown function (DUF4349)
MKKLVFLWVLMLSTASVWAQGEMDIVQRGGALTIKVTDFAATRDQLGAVAKKYGGGVVDSAIQVAEKGRKHGWVRVRVAVEDYNVFLSEARGMGKLYGEKLRTVSQTSRHSELEKRADKLQEHQTRLAGILGDKRRLRGGDLLFIQERLFRAGVDEEMLRQQRTDIAQNAKTATLTVMLFEPLPIVDDGGFKGRLVARFQTSLRDTVTSVTNSIADATGGFLLKLVLWLPILVCALILWQRHKNAIRRFVAHYLAIALPWAIRQLSVFLEWVRTQKKRLPSPVLNPLPAEVAAPVDAPNGL